MVNILSHALKRKAEERIMYVDDETKRMEEGCYGDEAAKADACQDQER